MNEVKAFSSPFLVQSNDRHDLELTWLVLIRWTALLSYVALLIASFWLVGFISDLVSLVCILVIAAGSNVALWLVGDVTPANGQRLAGAALSLDVLLLAALLYFCGGFTNPFSMMFLVYVALAAFFLDTRWTWIVFSLASGAFFALFFFHVSIPQLDMHAHHGAGSGFSLHLHGMLVAFVLIGAIISFFLTRMNLELSDRARQIEELREKEMERRQLVSLATITAGAAHELATPLATVSLIADDLLAAPLGASIDREDLSTMRAELSRCELVLKKMRGRSSELQGELPSRFLLEEVIADVEKLAGQDSRIVFNVSLPGSILIASLREALTSSLWSLVKNALQASSSSSTLVEVSAEVSDRDIQFTVRDRGCGMTSDAVQRMGEPFFTSKAPGEGMGLGVYLVKLFVSQLGGEFRVVSTLEHGTEVGFIIPRFVQL